MFKFDRTSKRIAVGVIACIIFLNLARNALTEAKKLPVEEYHVRHRGIHRYLEKIHRHIDRKNRENSEPHPRREEEKNAWKNSLSARVKRHHASALNDFILEVSTLQNASVCNYTLEPVGEEFGIWMSTNLHHIKCNSDVIGNKCQNKRPYCCIQTFEIIDLPFPNKPSQQVKIYTGCLCAYPRINKLLKPKIEETLDL